MRGGIDRVHCDLVTHNGCAVEWMHRDAESPALDSTLHCIGPLMQALHQALPEGKRGLSTETSDEMAAHLPELIRSGDVVMAKGSLSMALAQIVDGLRQMGHGSAPESRRIVRKVL